MPDLALWQVDAFTDVPFGGNPAAIVFDADGLDAATMQRIAREMNLSETAFVMRSERADFRLRFFTPAEEIDLAGHPTIATFHALVEAGRIRGEGWQTVTQELNVGVLPVEVEIRDGRAARVVMTQQPPRWGRRYEAALWAEVFGIAPDEFRADAPIQTVSTGTPQVMVPFRRRATLEWVQPDLRRLFALRQAGDWFSAHLFALEPFEPGHHTFARHFACAPGDTFEDPVTGSATGNMGCYLWHYGLARERRLWAEQGHRMGRPGLGEILLDTAADGTIERVRIAGSAVTVLKGTLSW